MRQHWWLLFLALVLALPCSAQTKYEYVTIFSDKIRSTFENGEQAITYATGNVRALYSSATIQADSLEYDHRTKDLLLSGNVIYSSPEQTINGSKIQINTKSNKWTLDDFTITIKPDDESETLLEPIFLRGTIVEQTPGGGVTAQSSHVTTCNLPKPHYDIASQKTTFIPGDRLILERTSMYLGNKKMYTIPRLVIPLTEKNDLRITPLVGQSDEEGYYLKTAYNYPTKKGQLGYLLLDFMSKKGIGEGIDHSYSGTSSSGRLRLYHIYDRTIKQNAFTGTMLHDTKIGDFRLNASADFRSNSYLYASGSKTFNERISVSRYANSSTRISLSRNVNDTYIKTTRLSGLLEHSQPLSKNLTIAGEFDYSGYSTGSYKENRLQSDVALLFKMPEVDISLSTRRFTDFNEEESDYNTFYGTEKLPELRMESGSRQLGVKGRPMLFSLAYGKYLELPSTNPVDRTYFALRIPSATRQLSDSWSVSNNGDFKQYIYSDATAQYVVQHTLQFGKRLGERSSFMLSHRFQRPDGYTPLRFDYNGRYNLIYANLSLRDSKAHTLSLSTGYNFETSSANWQDISVRSLYSPSNKFSLYTSTGYDPNLSQWRTLINRLSFRPNDSFKMGVASRYDTINRRWALVRGTLDTRIDPLTRLQLIQSYNGARRQFDYTALRLTRDLHCWEASLTYSQQKGFENTSGIMLNFRLKALPYYPTFGIGQYGESLEIGYFDPMY